MPGISATVAPLIPQSTPYPPDCRDAARAMRHSGIRGAEEIARGFDHVQANFDQINGANRNATPEIHDFVVTDGVTGRVIASLGQYEVNGIVTSGGYFSELYAGDPYGDSNPAHAILQVTPDGKVLIGQNGWVDVLDPYAADAAWIGTQFDTIAVTGAAAASGLIRLQVSEDVLLTGDSVRVLNVGGVPNATGVFTVTRIDATHVDLQNSVFVGTYTSGGTVDRLLHITGAANNGAGLIRLTRTGHAYESGDRVNIQSVGGVPNATGQWTVTVTSSSTFDLVGSTWAGAYTSGGTALRYFAGGLFQTIAIGPSFADYRLRAFADGTLRIRNAEIDLSGTGADIVLDPVDGTITVTQAGGGNRTRISGGGVILTNTFNVTNETVMTAGILQSFKEGLTTIDLSRVLDVYGYTGATAFGPVISFTQLRGAGGSASATQSGDTVGGIIGFGSEASGGAESQYPVAMRLVATQAHSGAAHGTQIIFEVCANGATVPITGMTLDQDAKLNVVGGYKINGAAGVGMTKAFGLSLTVGGETTALRGTPGVGQTQFTAVTSVVLNTESHTWAGGLLTV